MGQIYKRSGSEFYWLDYRNEDGRRIRRSSGQKEEAAAQRELDLCERSVASIVANKDRLSYQAAVVDFISHITVKNTRESCTASARQFDPYLAKLYVDEITVDHFKQFVIDRRRSGVRDSTIQQNLMFISGLFRSRGIASNPVQEFFRLKMLSPESRPMSILSEEEEKRLMAVLEPGLHRALVGFALETGLRKEELLTLRRHQVSVERREIRVLASQAKTKRHRIVPMTLRALKIYQELPEAKALVDWVFCRPDGRRVISVKQFFDTARRRAGIEHIRWHDLRHTYATRLAQAGVDIHIIARLLGHSNLDTTEIYMHTMTEDLHRRIAQFDKFRGDT